MITPYKNRLEDLDYRTPVEVYRNTNRKGVVYTIRQKGVVVAHADEIYLTNAEFHVSESGRKRVQKTGTKNVHAWVRGEITKLKGEGMKPVPVTYNPVKHKKFMRLDTRKPINSANFVVLNQFGVFADNSANL